MGAGEGQKRRESKGQDGREEGEGQERGGEGQKGGKGEAEEEIGEGAG